MEEDHNRLIGMEYWSSLHLMYPKLGAIKNVTKISTGSLTGTSSVPDRVPEVSGGTGCPCPRPLHVHPHLSQRQPQGSASAALHCVRELKEEQTGTTRSLHHLTQTRNISVRGQNGLRVTGQQWRYGGIITNYSSHGKEKCFSEVSFWDTACSHRGLATPATPLRPAAPPLRGTPLLPAVLRVKLGWEGVDSSVLMMLWSIKASFGWSISLGV